METRPTWTSTEGSPLPLGVTWVPSERAYNFALYSKHASEVTLLAFAADDRAHPTFCSRLDFLHHKSGRIWHTRVPLVALHGAKYYAYRVNGPKPDGQFAWHAFNYENILIDPYAPGIAFPEPLPNGGEAAPRESPLGVLPPPLEPPTDEAQSARAKHAVRHESDVLIYELHVRNFTRHPASGVAEQKRGTFAGIIEKIPYLVDLGVTAVELMPVFQNDPAASDRWGYMPLSFFALQGSYLASNDPCLLHSEFRDMVDRLHAADIEVILDVVFNHTCERGIDGPTYSYKGIDNSTYYLITADPNAPYANYSGTGNTLNCANHAVRKLILDSMRHWVRLGVDGFRFDLASIFTRDASGALRYDGASVLGDISGDPEFEGIRLIAEPWDAGASQLGKRFPGASWQQWNGAFRDDVRRFLRGDPGMVPAIVRRLYGSDDLFPDDLMHAFRPNQSVNYVTSHDGQTLCDLVSFNHKYNWANGQNNVDGPGENFSWNCGWEGRIRTPTEVETLRLRQAKNYFALLLLANGTPMIRAGDEFLHSQNGNDNPYNQDNETTWLDWSKLVHYEELHRFVKLMIAFRRAHPSLSRARFWREDVRWFGPRAELDVSPGSTALAFYLKGASEDDVDLYVMINAGQEAVAFDIQDGTAGGWRRVVDTWLLSPDDICEPGHEMPLSSITYPVPPHSVVVLQSV